MYFGSSELEVYVCVEEEPKQIVYIQFTLFKKPNPILYIITLHIMQGKRTYNEVTWNDTAKSDGSLGMRCKIPVLWSTTSIMYYYT